MADTCAPSNNYACYLVIQPPPPPAGPNNGDAGTPGAAAPAVEVDVPATAYPATQAIRIEVHAQDGGPGRNGHYSDVGTAGGLAGAGGLGGAGNTLTVTMQPGAVVNSPTSILSAGGAGGQAGHASHQNPEPDPGNAGQGGNVVAGTQAAPLSGSFTYLGGPALSVTSAGGAGAAGTNWDPGPPVGESSNYDGGDGGNGGQGGTVTMAFQGSVSGDSAGILALSQGGNGGNGGESGGTGLDGASGGNGGNGGLGSNVSVLVMPGSTTSSGSGIVAQSFGGQGGQGGKGHDASSGGSAGTGADAGTVYVENHGAVSTNSYDAPGILMQSFGGAGGSGGHGGGWGSGGGNGGTGGSGNSVQVVAAAESSVTTAGINSPGILLQSIGGGGGNAGDSNGWLSIGGDGSGAGNGGNVTIVKSTSGLGASPITTSGERSTGILAQSIGGGGGNGGTGDASAKSSGDNTNISSTVALGGTAGGGGNAGPVTVTNTGALLSLGDGAIGILAQAIGGGGGRGGGAAGTSNGTFTASVGVGGNGGAGGSTTQPNNANAVAVTNSGTLVTFGADAPGIVAQSIGGGGGTGGKSASTLGNNTNTRDGGNGSSSNVSAATANLNNAFQAGGERPVNQYNSVSGLIGVSNQALSGVTATRRLGDDPASDAQDLENLGESGGESGDDSSSTSITVHVNVGGRGGAGGSAGAVLVTNNASGSIGTVGAMSDGILAQAIGGGGGRGGAAVSSITSGKVNEGDTQGNVPISVGGRGGSGGSAGSAEVDNFGSVTTIGAQSIGIVAQSIAGGGGIAGTSAAKVQGNNANNTSVLSLPIAIGADGGGGGTSGTVTVNNSGSIITRSHDAIGILAQSITGGGGIVRTRSSDASDNNGGGAVATGGSYGINLTFGGNNCGTVCSGDPNKEVQPGAAGAVSVTHTGSITTGSVSSSGVRFGSNAYGILAQSIGGGGGVVLGGKPNNSANPFGVGAMTGDAGSVTVGLGSASGAAGSAGSITTYGQGAVAVLAQSIGGGGGLAGDTGLTAQRAGFQPYFAHYGNGGPILIQANRTATLTTNADNTPVILAQSIGGGGGRVTSNGVGANDGTAGGSGTGGTVTVNVSGQVQASGAASPGIFAESVGKGSTANPTGGAAVRINVGPGALVQGGRDFNTGDGYSAGIYIVGGSTNQDPSSQLNNNVNNQGTITSLGTTAIYSTGGWTSVYNQGGATITGSVNLDNGNGGGACPEGGCALTGGNVTNSAGGTINTGPLMRLGTAGTLSNSGTLSIGGAGQVATTAMTGNLVQTGTGRLVLDTNHSTGASDRIDVQGSVRLGGTLELHPAAVANRAVTVLTATGGVTLDPALASTRTHLFAFDTQQAGNSLLVKPRAEFTSQAAGLGANQRAVASHLQDLWNSGASMDAGFTALAGVRNGTGYGQALNSLSGQSVGAISASRFASSRDFSTNMLHDCTTFEGAGVSQDEASCGWARAFGSTATQDSTSGALGYKATSWTMQTGGQVQIAPGWFVGGSIAYQTSVFRGDAGSSKVSGDSVLVGGLLRYQTGPWQVSGAIDTGYGWYESRRSVMVGSFTGTAQGKPDAWHAGAHTRLAYQVPFGGEAGGWYVQPRADLHLNYVRSGGYTEGGATPFNLAVASEGATTFTAVPAVEVGGRTRIGEATVLRSFVSVGIELSANSDWAATTRLASQPNSHGFRAGTPIPNVLGKFTVGAELLTAANWDLRVQYSSEVGDDYTSHTGLARVAYRF
ncbi:autotransporter outer membrane beta-barrel domain-containing protein [Roseomonas gilardii]|uniref:autotransporter outer membrane beta-barrel domain-containing protein n=1 Tax=Roseomonas gilardii TaxID=257708 RepID=UPI00119DDE5A|nr:autotransporter outer membrane beta-barrel domain-containing protein [Roseomonas gilardii]